MAEKCMATVTQDVPCICGTYPTCKAGFKVSLYQLYIASLCKPCHKDERLLSPATKEGSKRIGWRQENNIEAILYYS